jgi:hypothetical protein
VKRTIAIGLAILGALTLVLASAPPAGARTFVKIRFHADHVTLTIPKPSCRPTHGTTSCQWTLAVTENLGPVTGRATGTAGLLSVAYPANYCGVIHAAAIVGPPIRKEVGHKSTIGGTCPTPGTTPPASASGMVVAKQPTAQPTAQPTVQPTAHQSQTASQTSGVSVLPFTGAPILDLLVVGILCLALAAYCLRRRPSSWTGSATQLLQP